MRFGQGLEVIREKGASEKVLSRRIRIEFGVHQRVDSCNNEKLSSAGAE